MHQHRYISRLANSEFVTNFGHVKSIGNTHIEADGPLCSVGDICSIEVNSGQDGSSLSENMCVDAEIVGVGEKHVTLVPFEQHQKISANARVFSKSGKLGQLPVGDGFGGRAVDALGNPIDGLDIVPSRDFLSMHSDRSPTLSRTATSTAMPTGIKAIDTILTLAKGQRVGIFAAAGVGKTTMVEQIARQVEADRTIICLVGERGQEVEAMWQTCQSMPSKKRFTLVAATSDESAALRVRAPNQALALAQFWRDQGEHVLLILDSATRLAMALREVGLAAGEPPTVRAYTPNVFSAMPRFVEKCGALKSGGAISAVMTVLAEQEDADDPLCEMMKSILDGHIVLSRGLAEQNQFPAIDIGRSISRQAGMVVTDDQAELARKARKELAIYEESKSFVESGVYKKGANPELDRAIDICGRLNDFFAQSPREKITLGQSFSKLTEALRG